MREVLDLPMQKNDADAETVGEYLMSLLLELWHEEESFSGKRPFGNSGWKYELYPALIKGGLVKGEIDEECGDLVDVDREAADELIAETIRSLFKGV